LSVVENVALPSLLAGEPEAEAIARAMRLLERLELAQIAAKLPEEISGGQSQRVTVARALVGKPRLVLADEPTGQQDRAFARLVMDVLLASTREADTALVVATHDPAVAGELDARWEMASGRLRTTVSA
jgi:predicted ABC-type transport system involved in lysophospholipase L1 biosynthesis ATPase subunit